jgi:hypothetical protein
MSGAARLAFNFAPIRSTRPPLALTDEEKDLLLSLAQPIDQRQRTEFLAAVAAELEAGRQADAVGIGFGSSGGAHSSAALFRSAGAAASLAGASRLRGLKA